MITRPPRRWRCRWPRPLPSAAGAVPRAIACVPSRPPAKKPPAAGGATMTWILSDSLSASVFWISSGFSAIESRVARQLLGVRLAGHLDAVRLGVGQLAARIGLGRRLDLARLGVALGVLHALHLARLGLQPALLDLLLLERQHVLHRLLARLGRDDLLGRGGLGRLLALDLRGVALQRRLLHLLLLQLQRVAHLLGRQLLGQHRLQARAVLRRQVDVAQEQRAHRRCRRAPAAPRSSCSIVVLDLDALVGEDLAHRVLGQRAVEDAVDDRLDQILADVGWAAAWRCRRRGRGPARSARVTDDADRQPLDGLERRRAVGRRAARRAVDLVAQRVAPQLVDERQHQRRPLGTRPWRRRSGG